MGYPKGKPMSRETKMKMRYSWSKEKREKYRLMALTRSTPKGFVKKEKE